MNAEVVRKRRLLMFVVPAVIVGIVLIAWALGGRTVSTDNAYAKANTVAIAPLVSGTVIDVPVAPNAHVKKGDLLFAIDPTDYRIAVDAAQAALYIEWARVEALRPEFRATEDERKKAAAEAAYYAKEVTRLENLRASQAVSEAQLDDMRHKRDVARAEESAAAQEHRRIGVGLNQDVNLPKEKHPYYQAGLAKLDKAKLDLARTRVVAPLDGMITNKAVVAGDSVAVGRTVMSIVQDSDVWIEANLKETELTHVQIGQPVDVRLDAYPGVDYTGSVESISAATGAEFALLPPQNASGNWVKIVQRIPVRIRVALKEGQPPLRAGLSADVSIDTGSNRLQRFFE